MNNKIDISWVFQDYDFTAMEDWFKKNSGYQELLCTHNKLSRFNVKELEDIFTHMSTNLTFLDISHNALCEKNDRHVSSDIGIQHNKLWAICACTQNLTTLNIAGNYLQRLPAAMLQKMKNTLPYVTHISLSLLEIKGMSMDQARALSEVFPNVAHVNFLDQDNLVVCGQECMSNSLINYFMSCIKNPVILTHHNNKATKKETEHWTLCTIS